MPTPHDDTHDRPPEPDPATRKRAAPAAGKASVPGQRTPYVDDRTGYLEMEQDPRFGALKKRQRSFIFPVTAAFLAWFLLYVVMSAYARDFMAKELIDHINVALVFGLLQFVSTFLIAWAYSRFARTRLDPVATELREELEA